MPKSVNLPAFFVGWTGKAFTASPSALGHYEESIGGIWNRRKKQTKRVKTLLSGESTCCEGKSWRDLESGPKRVHFN